MPLNGSTLPKFNQHWSYSVWWMTAVGYRHSMAGDNRLEKIGWSSITEQVECKSDHAQNGKTQYS